MTLTPDADRPEVATPDLASPEVTTSDVATSDVATPHVASPDLASPEARLRTRWLPLWVLAPLVVIMLAVELGEPAQEIVIGAVLYLALLAWAVVSMRRAGGRATVMIGDPVRDVPDWRSLWLVLPLLAFSVGALYLFWLPLTWIAPEWVNRVLLSDETLLPYGTSPVAIAAQIFLVVVAAAVVEEVVFRGVLLHRWAHRWGTPRAVLLTSLAFGVLHADPLGTLVFGIAMALLYLHTRSLWLPIGIHALHNGLLVIVEVLLQRFYTDPEEATIEQFQAEWWVGALFLLVSAPLLWRLGMAAWRSADWRPPTVRRHVPRGPASPGQPWPVHDGAATSRNSDRELEK